MAAGYDTPREGRPSPSIDVIAVGHLAMSLMQGAPLDDGRVGLEHPEEWPADAQTFLPDAICLTSAKELSQVSRAYTASTGSDSCSYHYFLVPVSRLGSNGSMILHETL